MKKKLFSLVAAVALALTLMPSASATTNNFDDIRGLPCEQAVNALHKDAIVNGTGTHTYSPKSPLTRAQMATILVRAYGKGTESAGKTFTDVPESHWAHSYISTAAAMGMVYGVSDTMFAPEHSVTLEQCVTMLLRSMGYENDAEKNGGYPNGYLNIARELGLLANVSEQRQDAALTRGDMAIIVYNGLNAEAKSSSLTKETFAASSGSTLSYWLYTPKNATAGMPLIVYLHGASGRGTDLDILMEDDGFPKYLKDGLLGDIPAYIVMPQMEKAPWSDYQDSIRALLNDLTEKYGIDTEQISLTGFSLGGTGTWDLAIAMPEVFSRIAPISGAVRTTDANINALNNTAVWSFVGSADTVITPNATLQFVYRLGKVNDDATVTTFDGATHMDMPALAYLSEEYSLINWLLSDVNSPNDETNASEKDDGMNMYENSDFIEKEQPELDEETKQLISQYQKNPTQANYLLLRDKVIENYNEVLERKENKLAELKVETAGKPGGTAIVAEMEEIVQEMYITYWDRINSSMLRFTDSRLLQWKIASAYQYDYIPVMGAGDSIYVKRTPVTNAEYAEYIAATGAKAPSNWTNGTYPANQANFPVNFVSYEDAVAYCEWLTAKDGVNTYRLPTESEWELAAGHMPKDADFNCGVNDGRTPVEQYAGVTRGAHGAIDFWGNVWEWTSTIRDEGDNTLGVKGGAWNSDRTDCRTEHRKEGRNAANGYEDVGFRVIQVLNGKEPENKVELATLDAPMVTATSPSVGTIQLSWKPVEGAVEYQIFAYFKDTGLVQMLDRTSATSITFKNLEAGTYHYIVQPISYTEIADIVSAEYSVSVTCK